MLCSKTTEIDEITVSDFLMGRITIEALPEDHKSNMFKLLALVNCLLKDFGEYRAVTSGYRRPEDNARAGGSTRSKHLIGAAIDLADRDGKLKKFMTEEMLDKYGLYMEHPDSTPSWCHLSILPPLSGKHIFKP